MLQTGMEAWVNKAGIELNRVGGHGKQGWGSANRDMVCANRDSVCINRVGIE